MLICSSGDVFLAVGFVVVLALVKIALYAGEQLRDESSLHLAAAEGSSDTGVLLAIIRPSWADTVQFGVEPPFFPSAFVVFPAVHIFLPLCSSFIFHIKISITAFMQKTCLIFRENAPLLYINMT
ncbi:MAG: hypothetical protein ACTFAL_07610 [Candidatus Electronema sp. V4]|uniref:hypothetical protein n=1 Tax=Candidatus Electronema sp. V4 TaxID=3454756 RepID=UPI0040557261